MALAMGTCCEDPTYRRYFTLFIPCRDYVKLGGVQVTLVVTRGHPGRGHSRPKFESQQVSKSRYALLLWMVQKSCQPFEVGSLFHYLLGFAPSMLEKSSKHLLPNGGDFMVMNPMAHSIRTKTTKQNNFKD